MALFRQLSNADVCEILAAFGLDPALYVTHHPIAAGTINTNVRVELRDGPRFLRVNEGKSRDDVEREAAIVSFLATRGLPTPVPLPSPSGEGFITWRGELLSLFPWVPGRTLSRAEVQDAHVQQVGSALGRMHRQGIAFPDRRAGRYEPAEILHRLDRIGAAARTDPALADAVAILGPELDRLGERRRAPIAEGLIHGDLFIDNVLFTENQLSALLDFEQASWGRLAYDVAVTLLAFTFGRSDFEPRLVEVFLRSYAAERPFSNEEKAAFADELRFAACRFAVTRITDVYLRRTEGAPPGKDFRRYLARLERVNAHVAAAATNQAKNGAGLLTLP